MITTKLDPRLAVVIPAYKITYLTETLKSLAAQTCKEFRVYIGDDGSPYDIASVVSSFSDSLDISYKRFEANLGGKDLVAHWERCIDLVGDEEWIWLFSDDDTMDPKCVEKFYEELPSFEKIDLIHFNVKKIDGHGDLLKSSRFPDFPRNYRIEDFCRDRLMDAQQSFVVEYIFRKSKFIEVGRFQNFDLAWSSDVATCIKLGYPGGIATIPGVYVYWRQSDQNISPNHSIEMVGRKLAALIDFLKWLNQFSNDHRIRFSVSPVRLYLRRWLSFRGRIGLSQTIRDVKQVLSFKYIEYGTDK